jgi:hypothetical protein
MDAFTVARQHAAAFVVALEALLRQTQSAGNQENPSATSCPARHAIEPTSKPMSLGPDQNPLPSGRHCRLHQPWPSEFEH